ncbi:MAG: hypothetical protein AB7D29_00625 [Campylobacterales bacterium]
MTDTKKFDLAKALTFLLVFTAICVISLTTMLVPSIRDYKKQNDIYKIEYSLYLKAKERHDEESAKLQNLKTANSKIIAALGRKTDETSLLQVAKNHFAKTDIKKIGALQKEGGFFYEDYNVTSAFKTPKEIFGFLKSISEENAVVKVQTPLVMAGNDGGLISNFALRVYYMDTPKEAKGEKTTPPAKPQESGHQAH